MGTIRIRNEADRDVVFEGEVLAKSTYVKDFVRHTNTLYKTTNGEFIIARSNNKALLGLVDASVDVHIFDTIRDIVRDVSHTPMYKKLLHDAGIDTTLYL